VAHVNMRFLPIPNLSINIQHVSHLNCMENKSVVVTSPTKFYLFIPRRAKLQNCL
jgi:hypothetical protein